MEKQEKLVLIDGNSLINRAFYALPLLTNSNGQYSNAVFGFCNILLRIIEAEKPKYFAVAFDMGAPTFRHKMYADYKAGRKKMPDELASQMPMLKNLLNAMNISVFEKEGIEADDLIGSLAKKFDIPTIIVSGDRDLFQLVDNTTTVWFTKRGVTDILQVTPNNIEEVYGVKANQVVDLKSLMGDSSDNIKGVAGIGEKTAKNLINQYGSLDNIYQNIAEIKQSVATKLTNGKEDAILSQQLATINTTVNLEVELADLEYDFPFSAKVYQMLTDYEIFSLTKRVELFKQDEVKKTKKVVNIKNITNETELDALIDSLLSTKLFSIYVDNFDIHISNSKFEENIIKIKQNLIDEGIDFQTAFSKLKSILEDINIKKICLDSKKTKRQLYQTAIDMGGVVFDSNLAIYLLSGSKKTDIDAKQFTERYEYDENCIAVSLFYSKDDLTEKLKTENMLDLYQNIELPLVEVLFQMELNGFKVDIEQLKALSKTYKDEIEVLSQQICDDAGQNFNLNSPKQLGEILFEKLNLELPKNMKKSTSVEVLERISSQHPIIEKILRYRKIEKLYSTYIEPFIKIADKNNFIHTIFNQTLTATGRLSSSEPNLQNIPIRDDEGKNLRKIFISRFENGKIVTSDYSQIELRLLASYSKDEKLLEAYKNNIDIHSQTASHVFGVPLEAVTPKMRRDAKAVNFGIIYGISDYGLSLNINSSRKEAKQFIDKYFETYSKVKDFMDGLVEFAKENGYVTTLLGRKRKIDEINSSNYLTRQFGERAAMNMPLQGTASDIIKLAMVNVHKELKSKNLKSKLILQIHDELIVDCPAEEEEIVKDILKEQMENVIKLNVPLIVDIQSGDNWFEAK